MAITTIVFDVGDTLLKVNPDDPRPMVEWETIEVVDGARHVLATLVDRHKLAVASNADVSNGPMMKAALARVGLDRYFTAIFSSVDLGFQKPHSKFFDQVVNSLGDPPKNIVMIGDSYVNDVLGATRVGWRAIWYNSTCTGSPGLVPYHSAEISRLSELPTVVKALHLPTIDVARSWLVQQNVSANLLAHVEMVAAIAYQMAVWLRQAGEPIDPILVHRGGLLHDLAKVTARLRKVDHGLLAGQLLEEKGQPALAEIARRHVLFNLLDGERQPTSWEEKLVYFADKLVEAGHLVSFQHRLEALQNRYNINTSIERMAALVQAITDLEKDICGRLSLTPAGLLEELHRAYFGKNS